MDLSKMTCQLLFSEELWRGLLESAVWNKLRKKTCRVRRGKTWFCQGPQRGAWLESHPGLFSAVTIHDLMKQGIMAAFGHPAASAQEIPVELFWGLHSGLCIGTTSSF